MPAAWSQIAHAMNLCDYLTFQATGHRSFSLCAAVCKWQYDGERSQWNHKFLESASLSELRSKIQSARVCSVGEPAEGKKLSRDVAAVFGITTPGDDVIVAAGMIDAHAGALGLLGASYSEEKTIPRPLSLDEVEQRAALICGTSTCFMAVRRRPVHVSGVWGIKSRVFSLFLLCDKCFSFFLVQALYAVLFFRTHTYSKEERAPLVHCSNTS